MITIIPAGGLGNRLRSLRSAIKLAKDVNQELTVVWEYGPTVPCFFEDLIENVGGGVRVYNFVNDGIRKTFFSGNIVKGLKIIHGRIKYRYIGNGSRIIRNPDSIAPEIIDYIASGKDYFINSFTDFYGDKDYDDIVFKKGLVDQADNILKEVQGNCVGIHIRQGDNTISIHDSPVYLFDNLINELIRKNTGVNFFIATDEPKVLEKFVSKFGDRCIYFRDKVWEKNLPKGQTDALIEMLCLSRTNIIYGSHFSSYSEEAARIGKIDKITLKIEDE